MVSTALTLRVAREVAPRERRTRNPHKPNIWIPGFASAGKFAQAAIRREDSFASRKESN
jgi:hypothetical protein